MVTALWYGYMAVRDSEQKEGLSDGVKWNLVTGYPLDWKWLTSGVKNSHILPTGQWYTLSAVNYSAYPAYLALSCTILHYLALSCAILRYLALSCAILRYLALSCTILHYLAISCTILHYLALSGTILHILALSCTILHSLALSCAILRYLALSCTILHYLSLSCTLLHYLASSCTILHDLALSCNMLHSLVLLQMQFKSRTYLLTASSKCIVYAISFILFLCLFVLINVHLVRNYLRGLSRYKLVLFKSIFWFQMAWGDISSFSGGSFEG